MIVAGDIGGTKCSLALFELQEDRLISKFESTYPSRRYPGLEVVVARFLSEKPVRIHQDRISAFSFGIAGPVVQGTVRTPNLPWTVSVELLRERFATRSVALLNDLEATGYGVLILKKDEIKVLNRGKADPQGNLAIIAAGTGLGEAFIVASKQGPIPIPSEGGHTDFAPRNDREMSLLAHLMKRFDRVSYERVLSGPGLLNIYTFLRESTPTAPTSWFDTEVEKTGDPSAVVSQAALDGKCPLCKLALEMFVEIYGREAGNLALTVKATGGVFICGGIAPKILPRLTGGLFMKAFRDKGRLEKLLASIPVSVVLNPKTALHGAADYARRFLCNTMP